MRSNKLKKLCELCVSVVKKGAGVEVNEDNKKKERLKCLKV